MTEMSVKTSPVKIYVLVELQSLKIRRDLSHSI